MTALILSLGTLLAADPSPASLPPLHEIQQQLTQGLKREAEAKSPAAKAEAISDLCALHRQIVRDPRCATSDTLQEYRARAWSRLTKAKTQLKQSLARDNRDKRSLDDLALLETADAPSIAAADSLASSLALLETSQGYAGSLLQLGGRAIPPDLGPALVNLIERTINPTFWDTVGGPGTIYYYAPLQCLVVRATAEVHESVGGVVGNLRGAGP